MEKRIKQVTAVLPARNCRKELARCLAALSAGDCPMQLIVVDDASSDGSAQMVRERWPEAVLLEVPVHTGFAHAANLGLRLVRTEYALLIRPDLQPGKTCADRLLEKMEDDRVFCAVPRFLQKKEAGAGKAVPLRNQNMDGCAVYRMKALEETGWFDERHFDGLEALDLSLRAAMYGWKTVRVPDALVLRTKTSGFAGGIFRRQLAAGNRSYLLYKHLSVPLRVLGFPALKAADAMQALSFAGSGETEAYRMAQVRGKALCSLEKERREALADGVSVWAESLPEASFLGMEDAAETIYPLFLAEKEPFSLSGLPDFFRMQVLLLRSLPELYSLEREEL